jgi:integrase
MPRPNKIWFRKDIGWWMVTLSGKKVRLAKGKENRKLAEQRFHELMVTRHVSPELPDARVADLVEAFLDFAKPRLAEETYRNYLWYSQKFAEACGQLSTSQLKPYHLTRWIDARGWNETTERNARRIAHRVFSWAKQEGLIGDNPLAGVKCPSPRNRDRALSEAEFRTLLGAAHGPFRVLLWSLRQTGARPSELRRLTWDQVRDSHLVISQHKTAKKVRKPRVIYLTPAMQRLLAKRKAKSKSNHVFVNTRGKPWTTNAIRLNIQRIREKTNLSDDVCAYLLRHTFGTRAIMNGLNTSEVAELMGHTSTEMIDRVYVHLADQVKHMQEAVERATRAEERHGKRRGKE